MANSFEGVEKSFAIQAGREIRIIVKPDTILAWHHQLVAQKFDGSNQRKAPGRPTTDQELEALVVGPNPTPIPVANY